MRPDDNHVWRVALIGILLAAGAWLLGRQQQRDAVESLPQGWTPNPDGTRKFLLELPSPYFAQAAPDPMRDDDQRDAYLYRYMVDAYREVYRSDWTPERQQIGDCVSMGFKTCAQIAHAIDYYQGRVGEPPLAVASEPLYGGSRVEARGKDGDGSSPVGGFGDGSYGGAAAKWLRDWGVIYRTKYGDRDYTAYSGKVAKEEGAYGAGGKGDGGRIDAEAKKHPCLHVVAIRTIEEATRALQSGYPIAVCSGAGYSSRRDEDGFSNRQGSWSHCMAAVALKWARNNPDMKKPRDGILIQNSWGSFNSGGKHPADQPEGSFWISFADFESMLRANDSFAIGSVDGWPHRKLDHGGWLATPPPVE